MKFPTPSDRDCVICYEEISPDLAEHRSIRVPCCGRYFHRPCIQRYAVISGKEHFKCSNCNDKTKIMKELERMGVYLPVKDADWEDNLYSGFYNYQDMYQQKKTCDVVSCLLTDREVSEVDTVREIVLCEACGINGSHIKCSSLSLEDSGFTCADCGGDVEMIYKAPNTSRPGPDLSVLSLDTTASSLNITTSSLDITASSLNITTSSLDTTDSSLDITDAGLDISNSSLDTTASSLDLTDSDSASLSDVGTDLDTSDSLPDVDEFLRKFETSSVVTTSGETSGQTSFSEAEQEGREETSSAGKGNFFKLAEDFENFLDEVKRKKPASNAFMDVSKPSEVSEAVTEVKPRNSSLIIRTDLFSSDNSSQSTLSENIHVEAADQIPASSELEEDTEMDIEPEPVFVISDNKRKFAAFLVNKAQTVKKSSSFLTEFYQMLAPEDFSAEEQREKESNEVSVVELDETVEVESPQLSEQAATEAAATVIKILDTFTLEEEATPLKMIPPTVSPKDSKKKSRSPVTRVSPKLSEEPVRVVSPVVKSSVSSEPAKVSSLSPTVQPEKPYRPGPRSRTKPHVAPVRQPSSPRQSPQTPPENLASPVTQTQPPVTVEIQPPVTEEIQPPAAVETKSPVRYRPGPKSRKKFLVVKEDESEKVCDAASPKRKTEDLSQTVSPSKKPRVDTEVAAEQADESIEDIEKFLAETDTIMEVSPAPPNQAALDRRRAKRPYQCPVCQGFFRFPEVLKQHMAKIHFWQRLLQFPRENQSLHGPFWVCSEAPCHYAQKSREIIAGHIATDHQVVFNIAKTLFPEFSLPQMVVTIDDEVVVETTQSSNNNNNNLSQLKTSQTGLVTVP